MELSEHATVPVINALTHAHHPCQGLADVMTIRERFGDPRGMRAAYVGDGNNCCHSLMVAGAHLGMEVVAGCPDGYLPDPEVVRQACAGSQKRQARWARDCAARRQFSRTVSGRKMLLR